MARAQFYDVGIDSQGNAITTTKVSVFLRGTTVLATIYENENGATPKSNPFDATTGFITFWSEPGEYDIQIEDINSPPSFATRTIGWSSIPAVDGVLTETIVDEAVTSNKIEDLSIDYTKNALSPDNLSSYGAMHVREPKNILGTTTVNNTITSANISTLLLWDSVVLNTGSCFSASTGIYTAPLNAMYVVSFKLGFAMYTSGRLIARAGNYYTSGSVSSDYNLPSSGVFITELSQNATIGLHAGKNSSAGVSIKLVNDSSSYFCIYPIYRIS